MIVRRASLKRSTSIFNSANLCQNVGLTNELNGWNWNIFTSAMAVRSHWFTQNIQPFCFSHSNHTETLRNTNRIRNFTFVVEQFHSNWKCYPFDQLFLASPLNIKTEKCCWILSTFCVSVCCCFLCLLLFIICCIFSFIHWKTQYHSATANVTFFSCDSSLRTAVLVSLTDVRNVKFCQFFFLHAFYLRCINSNRCHYAFEYIKACQTFYYEKYRTLYNEHKVNMPIRRCGDSKWISQMLFAWSTDTTKLKLKSKQIHNNKICLKAVHLSQRNCSSKLVCDMVACNLE